MTLPRARAAPALSTPDLPDAPHTATARMGMAARRPPGSSTLAAPGDSHGRTQGGTVQHTACTQMFCHPAAKPQPPGCQRQCHRQRAALKTPHRGLCLTAIHAPSQISPGPCALPVHRCPSKWRKEGPKQHTAALITPTAVLQGPCHKPGHFHTCL